MTPAPRLELDVLPADAELPDEAIRAIARLLVEAWYAENGENEEDGE